LKEMLVPDPLKPGDKVGVISISGPVDEELLNRGISVLRSWGLAPVTGPNVLRRTGYLAGADQERLSDLELALNNREVKAIYFARGGYGSMRILDKIPVASLVSSPKMLIGMSDLTALQMSLVRRAGLVSFAGPTLAGQVAKGLDSISHDHLVDYLFLPSSQWKPIPEGLKQDLSVIRHGGSQGIILGGCLSILSALLGTSHLPNFDGAILLLEDINEPEYRIDRMFTQLKLAGVLDRISALILGHFIGPKGERLDQSVAALASELTPNTVTPIIGGFPHGHRLPNLTVPIGARMNLDTYSMELSFHAGDPL
jgi:muramoyltetrapeptide carboxypeptidase